MKKTILFLLVLGMLGWGLQAVSLDVGLQFGTRSVKDADVKEVYGNGSAFFPYVSVGFWKGLFAGIGYEGGYDRDGKIGIYQEDSNLKVAGFELFAGYRLDLGKVSPYAKLGFASFSYQQTVSGVSKFDENKSALTLAGGARYYPAKKWFLAGEIKYVPLKVKPLTEKVDLSGLRLSLGVGYTFTL